MPTNQPPEPPLDYHTPTRATVTPRALAILGFLWSLLGILLTLITPVLPLHHNLGDYDYGSAYLCMLPLPVIAAAILFLAEDSARAVNGIELRVDSGQFVMSI